MFNNGAAAGERMAEGCQAILGGNEGKCGEMRSLGILKEFQQLYEDKLSKIENSCNCTSSKAKVQMLQDWVKDLTEQNTLLVQVVEELEQEASERVALLEEKLQQSSKTSYEIMKTLQEFDSQKFTEHSDTLEWLTYYQSDIHNLTEYIRRIRDDGVWSVDGMKFYSVQPEDILNDVPISARDLSKQETEDTYMKLKTELSQSKESHQELERETKIKEKVIRDQSEQIEKLNNVVERCATSMPDRQRLIEELHDLKAQLKYKTEEYTKLDQCDMEEQIKLDEYQKKIDELMNENNKFKDTMKDASKEIKGLKNLIEKYNREQHEVISELKNKILRSDSVTVLHDIRQCDSSTEFSETDSDLEFVDSLFMLKTHIGRMYSLKDSEEIMKLKSQLLEVENVIQEVESKNQLIKNKDEMIKIQSDTLEVVQKELIELRVKVTEIEEERDVRLQEVRNLQQALKINQNTIEELEKALGNAEEKATNMQQTVDIYVETIQLLENAKQKAELDIEQQRITIGNLQDALVNTKHQLSELQRSGTTDVSWSFARWTGSGNANVSKTNNTRKNVHDI